MRSWIAVLVCAAACRGQSKESPKSATETGSGSGSAVAAASGTAGSAAGSSADPWAKPAKPKAPPTPEEKRARAEAALTRVADIQTKLAALRGLPLPKPIPAELQSTEDFRKFVQKDIAKDLPPEKAANMETALHHLGVLKQDIDLAKVLEQTMTSQAAAYYDPGTKKFFVVMAPDNDTMLDTMTAHELTHALQDENFNLKKLMSPDLDDDAGIARRFLVEGDATFSMFAYLVAGSKGPDAVNGLIKLVGGQIEKMADMTIDDFAAQMKAQAGSFVDADPDMKKAMESMGELPPVIIVPLIDSYMKGAVVSMRAFEAGGWKAIDALYKNPPTSTEQVLHPKEKLIGTREEPRKVKLPKLPGTEIQNNVMGELQWSIYLQQWGVKQPDATAGWGGDRYAVMKGKDGNLVGYLATNWDSDKDAVEFRNAYLESLKQRFPGAETALGGSKDETVVKRPDHGNVIVRLQGANVFIVDGAEDAKALDMLAKGTKVK
jgi:hypothetical protein